MLKRLLLILTLAMPLPAMAQDEDKGFLTNLLEDSLGGEGRAVSITGFAGALSSQATIERIEISDTTGIWLQLDDIVLDWNRAALLRGRIEVQTLSAAAIVLPRFPAPAGTELPAAEATEFSLPDLPVSINVETLKADRIVLGAPILGEAATLSLTASGALADGAGNVTLSAARIDGQSGQFDVAASYAPADQLVSVKLALTEGEAGLVARLLDLPGLPSLDLQLEGDGPLHDFATDLSLATDGAERLRGRITLAADDAQSGDRQFAADISGDVTALFAPQYQPFFGDDLALTVAGSRAATGALDLDAFALRTQVLQLEGSAALSDAMWPEALNITGALRDPAGSPVLLPLSGPETRVDGVTLRFQSVAGQPGAWTGAFDVTGLSRDDVAAAQASLTLASEIDGNTDNIAAANTQIQLTAEGVAFSDPALAQALGAQLTAALELAYRDAAPLQINALDMTGTGYRLAGDATIDGLEDGLSSTFDLALNADNLAQFAALAGQPLTGQAALSLRGSADLGGSFAVDISGQADDLGIGQAQADAVLAGQTILSLRAARDLDGTTLETLDLRNAQISMTGDARLQTGLADVNFEAELVDAGLVVPDIEGPLNVAGRAVQDSRGWSVDVSGDGPYDAAASVKGLVTGPNARVDFSADIPDITPLAPDFTGAVALSGNAAQSADGWLVDADLSGPYGLEAAVKGRATGLGAPDIAFDAILPDISPFAPQFEGPVTVSGTARQEGDAIVVDTDATGPYGLTANIAGQATGPNAPNVRFTAQLPDIGPFAPQFEGPVTVSGTARQEGDALVVDTEATGPYGLTANVAGQATGPNAPNVRFDARLPDISPFAPQFNGPVTISGTAQQDGEALVIDTDATGPYGLTASVAGEATGPNAPNVTFTARLPNVRPLAPQFNGPATINGTARRDGEALIIDTEATGPYGLTASVAGQATGPNAPNVTFTAAIPNVRPLAPQFNGAARVEGTARQDGDALVIDTDATGPYGLTASVKGPVTGGAPAVEFTARLPNVAPLVPQLTGPLQVQGNARQEGTNWFIDTAANGPAGSNADVVGRVGADGRLALSVAGNAPLALANPFIAPRNIQGGANFDLRVDGVPGLSAVSGQVSARGARLSAPNLGFVLNDIATDITMAQGRATLAVDAAISTGGTISLRGPVTLSGRYPADLSLALSAVQLVDPALYRTTVNGALGIRGPLLGGARIAGGIEIGETRISVPSSGLGGFTIVPEITHLGASRAVRVTQGRAGLNKPSSDGGSGGGGTAFPLDISVNAPSRIFVRGRGLDAELGGNLRLSGDTNNIISSGRFELIRGRLDILEKRFDLDEGSIQLQGSFDPFLRFVATTQTSNGSASVVIEGPASAPEVSFVSSPEAPEDEVLAQIFFGRDAANLSAFQALQLASAVATLAGRGGEGVVSKLRRSFDLDDLDVTSDADGNAAVRAGKYLSDNVYTDVTVGGADGAEVSINIDLTPNLTARGTATATGGTGIGIYFEKDY